MEPYRPDRTEPADDLYHLDDIARIVPTTLPISHATHARLERYRVGVTSWDRVLNEVLDEVDPERFVLRRVRSIGGGARVRGPAQRLRRDLGGRSPGRVEG